MKRADEFLALYNSGLTHQQIGEKFDLSRARIHIILSRHPDYKPMTRAQRLERRNQAIRQAYIDGDYTISEIAKAFSVSERTIYYVVKDCERRRI